MKKLLLLLILFFHLLLELHAQMVYIPDSAFRQKLITLGMSACLTGDSIDPTCFQVLNRNSLDVSNGSIHNLQGIQAFTNLSTLKCNYNPGLTIPALPSSITWMECYYCGLASLPPLPPNLFYLNCSYNGMTTLPAMPSKLTDLDCSYGLITTLSGVLNDSLQTLICDSNKITYLPFPLPSKLRILHCNNNNLVNIVPLIPGYSWPTGLTELELNSNRIDSLRFLPPALNRLSCGGNSLHFLPAFPSTLRYLNCSSNRIGTLPPLPNELISLSIGNDSVYALLTLPDSLRQIDFRWNYIDTLFSLPSYLNYMNGSNNLLRSLPDLPSTMRTLYVNGNNLNSLPESINYLTVLDCSNNHLTYIPPLRDTMQQFHCGYNDSLYCLPKFNNMYSLDFNMCPITCLSGYGHVDHSYPPLNAFPLCGIFNPSGCNFFWNIGGKTFYDINSNCIQSSNERGIKNSHINLYQNGSLVQQAFTGGEGFYSFDTNGAGIYDVEIDTVNKPYTSICPGTNTYSDTATATDSLFYDNDFSLICRNGFDVGTWSVLTSGLRPNHFGVVNIKAGDVSNLYGMHCASGINGSVSITINGDAHYFGPAPGSLTPSNVSGNIITYNISDFGTIDPDSDFTFVLLVDSTATNGSQICFNVNVNPVSGDNYNNNNILSQCFTVLASYDPNYKEVYPYGKMDPSIRWLTYTVHFQNTGGAPAENIYILDTLDINLDVSTFEVLSTSHQSYVQILEGGIARFNFSNINLIDSTSDEPQSHGYVQYKIKLKNNLTSGTQVKNTASIYFDFNSPINTNTTINTIDFASGINIIKDEHSFDVWPVPVHDELIIQYLSNSKVDFTLYNVFGRALTKGKVQNELIKIKMEGWTNGIYFVKVGDSVKCIVKE